MSSSVEERPDYESSHSTTVGSQKLLHDAALLGQNIRTTVDSRSDGKLFFQRFELSLKEIREGYKIALAWAAGDLDRSPVVDWVLDNYYSIQERIEEIQLDLPREFFRELPKVTEGQTRIQLLASELLRRVDCALDSDLIESFANAFQESISLTIGECWAYLTCLKIGLLERLAEICTQLKQDYSGYLQATYILKSLATDGFVALQAVQQISNRFALMKIEEGMNSSDLLSKPHAILDICFSSMGLSREQFRASERHRLAAAQVSIGNVITSLRFLSGVEWIEIFEAINKTEKILRTDGIYSEMEFATQNRYRGAVETLSKESGLEEIEIANRVVTLTRIGSSEPLQSHVGYWLMDAGRRTLEEQIGSVPSIKRRFVSLLRENPSVFYFSMIALVVLVIEGLFVAACETVGVERWVTFWLSVVGLVPISEIAIAILNWGLTHTLPVDLLPKMKYSDEVPECYPTFVVMPTILTSEVEVLELLGKLENHFLTNGGSNLFFALLTDFADSDFEHLDSDTRLREIACEGIDRLNRKYHSQDSPFYLFHRHRQWNDSERKWMGWERKRGKLLEFGSMLLDKSPTSFSTKVGGMKRLDVFREKGNRPYVITLDSDTRMPRDAARRLIGTASHPLNRAVLSDDRQSLKRGFAIFQPRVSIHLADSNRSRYFIAHTGRVGLDPYPTAASDVYQDLFGEGSFTGKGIYDLLAFDEILHERFPVNSVLSHDLIEGAFARVALVSDIEFFDGYPSRYDVDAKRLHRWTRGDWQIASWLLPRIPTQRGYRANPLSLLSRWKITDNLRRSLLAPSLFLFLLIGWLADERSAPLVTIGLLISLATPVLLLFLELFLGWKANLGIEEKVLKWLRDLSRLAELAIYRCAFLPHQALMMTDAISKALYRTSISKKNLLEWETAAAVDVKLRKSKWAVAQKLTVCSIIAIALFFISSDVVSLYVLPVVGLWLVSPAIGHVVSRSHQAENVLTDISDQALVLRFASGTWAYFEAFVGQSSNWLPPDNIQEFPRQKTANRISPTNEGMYLVSCLCAHNLGFASASTALRFLEQNLNAWQVLPTHNGHHFNWYDTETLKPLKPSYISTVDSGNLLASYITTVNGLGELSKQPMLRAQHVRAAIATLEWLTDSANRVLNSSDMKSVAASVRETLVEFTGWTTSVLTQLNSSRMHQNLWTEFLDTIAGCVTELDRVSNDMTIYQRESQIRNLTIGINVARNRFWELLEDARRCMTWHKYANNQSLKWGGNEQRLLTEFAEWPSLELLSAIADRVNIASTAASSDSERSEMLAASAYARDRLVQIERIRNLCARAASIMDFSFLFVKSRELFSIGLNLETGKLDRGYYDLLSSESRLASFLAIARGEVKADHWFRLGRQSAGGIGGDALLSWGGTMFEYLMPNLFLRSIPSSLLDQSSRNAVRKQILYSEKKHTPWGISESAFSAVYRNSDYQYKSFGVPGLGLKRGLSRDLVISPYSTMLAMMLEPSKSISNLKRMMPIALGSWGFYDAIDFTHSRLREGEAFRTVLNYMAHHQGMSLLAMTNVLSNNIIQNWFHSEPVVQANELLLEEKIPVRRSHPTPNEDELQDASVIRAESTILSRKIRGFDAAIPKTHFLSNGRLNVMLTHSGGSSCSLGDLHVTRWHPDTTRDHWGMFLYVHNMDTSEIWSATYQPTCVRPDSYEALFSVDKAEFRRVQGTIESTMEVVVSPEHNAEVRQIRLVNNGPKAVTLELTSYAEICLATRRADQSHPAFQKLFVETEYVNEDASILARKRPREKGQATLFAVHTIAVPGGATESISFDSSRETFLGRCRDTSNPIAMESDSLAKSIGAVLDPVFALRCRVTIESGESLSLGFTTSIAETREEAIFLADFYHDLRGVQRAFELAWAYAQSEFLQRDVEPKQLHMFHQLGGYLLYPNAARSSRESASTNQLSQEGLWKFGISGDHPILLLKIDSAEQLDHVKTILQSQRFLNSKGLEFDVVLVNDYPGTYFDSVNDLIRSMLENYGSSQRHSFLLRGTQLSAEERTLLEAAATVAFDSANGGVEHHLRIWETLPTEPNLDLVSGTSVSSRARGTKMHEEKTNYSGMPRNGYGSFSNNAYAILNRLEKPTPMPWSNILSNQTFGTVITNFGGGHSWFGNSRENKLTTWSNDPVSDPPSEILYLRDRNTGRVWSPTSPLDNDNQTTTLHGHGFTTFACSSQGITSDVMVVVDNDLPIKYIRLDISNQTPQPLAMDVTYFAETVLGVHREATAIHQVSTFDESAQCLVMRNGFSNDYPNQQVFLKMLGADELSWTCNRQAFIGRHGAWKSARGIRTTLDGQTGTGIDPCMVLRGSLQVEPGEKRTVVFLFGTGSDYKSRLATLESCETIQKVQNRIEQTREHWARVLESIQIKTPSHDFDQLVNGWLLYQTIACRIFGRSAFYQSGGAFGFRDQLQDVMAVVYSSPELAREQILRSAARQYVEGDVQHWWHPPSGKGTRTRFSDDFLFLPFVVCHYIRVTGDDSVLQEVVPFVTSPSLTEAEHERYEQPFLSEETATLLEHCIRAIGHGMKYGRHGLPLMGCGDWNDGMSRVGIGGQGESVWVGWFQIVVFEQFSGVLIRLGERPEFQQRLIETVASLRRNLEEHAWDGEWYVRAFFDDGKPLGNKQSEECNIDSLAQSWSVIANGATEHAKQAFRNAVKHLYLRDEKMVLLFTPPFERSDPDPGYIQGYLSGVRENGGQYTHAALWMVQAGTLLGFGDLSFEMFQSLNPIRHTQTDQDVHKYKIEPYVVAADVYANPQHIGRGGWSWYTGSAAWMYRVALENILGLKQEGNRVTFAPCVPRNWTEFQVTLKMGKSTWIVRIKLTESHDDSASSQALQLHDDGEIHQIELTVANLNHQDEAIQVDEHCNATEPAK